LKRGEPSNRSSIVGRSVRDELSQRQVFPQRKVGRGEAKAYLLDPRPSLLSLHTDDNDPLRHGEVSRRYESYGVDEEGVDDGLKDRIDEAEGDRVQERALGRPKGCGRPVAVKVDFEDLDKELTRENGHGGSRRKRDRELRSEERGKRATDLLFFQASLRIRGIRG
jgi:hypothetical protein